MIAHGDAVCTGIQNILRLIGGDAHHSGIFSVDHHKVRIMLPLQLAQMTAYPVQAGISHHISHSQYFPFHRDFLQTILLIII